MTDETKFTLTNKVIYIISPNNWGKMKLSKHHYAIELGNKGNRVFFIEPADLSGRSRITIRQEIEHSNLWIIRYRPVARGRRFLPFFIFKMLIKQEIKILKRVIRSAPDLVISFDPSRFENLKWFGAAHSIYFAADLYQTNELPGEVQSADFCLGVSPTILELLKQNNPDSYFINHGLGAPFESYARKRLEQHGGGMLKKEIIVGYIGNLLMGAPDRSTMRKVILAHPEVKFIFWGQYDEKQDHMVPHREKSVTDFIDFLQSTANVELRGPKDQPELVSELDPVDMFWICYDLNKSWFWDGSNSHKILEYLATGKPVIAHHIAAYTNTDLLYMMESNSNERFQAVFDATLEKVKKGEAEGLANARIYFALSNTYKTHVSFIESKLNVTKAVISGNA